MSKVILKAGCDWKGIGNAWDDGCANYIHVCYGRVASNLLALWAREAAGHLSLVARYDEVDPVGVKS
eukprot:761105-Pelagomonas_calceolata.AAC.1